LTEIELKLNLISDEGLSFGQEFISSSARGVRLYGVQASELGLEGLMG